MKYLLVLFVVVVGVMMLASRVRKSRSPGRVQDAQDDPGVSPSQDTAAGRADGKQAPGPMIACSHCGVHLPADEAVFDGTQAYCGRSHQQAGPR